jgi:uncharacterized protein (TIGR00251 family)
VTAERDLRRVVSPRTGGSTLTLTVSPRASRNQLELQDDGVLRVRITAPPVEGAANSALLKFLATKLGIPRSRLTLAAGEGSRHKRIAALDVSAEELTKRVHHALETRR